MVRDRREDDEGMEDMDDAGLSVIAVVRLGDGDLSGGSILDGALDGVVSCDWTEEEDGVERERDSSGVGGCTRTSAAFSADLRAVSQVTVLASSLMQSAQDRTHLERSFSVPCVAIRVCSGPEMILVAVAPSPRSTPNPVMEGVVPERDPAPAERVERTCGILS
jgi:hypothetical protein